MAANPDLEAGMRLFREGHFEPALASFGRVLAADPRHSLARGWRGLVLARLGDFDGAEAELATAVRESPRDAFLQNGLASLMIGLDRLDEAQACLRRALAISPAFPDALANLCLVLRSRGDFAGAERAGRKALAGMPSHMQARINLAFALLAQAKYAEAWPESCARPDPRLNPRGAVASPFAHASSLPAPGAPVILHGEQGLGDALFYLRFAPMLKARGHPLAFWGDTRLHSLLARTGLFDHFLRPEAAPGEGIALVWVGDLPCRFEANDPARFPPPLPLVPDPTREARWRERLAAWGPPPYIGITWRAGIDRRGTLGLAKLIDPATLGATLSGIRATWVSLQRLPAAGEAEAFASACGVPLHDATAMNDDLEDALALLSVLDDYVGVSNTNTHLRAAAGRDARVLVAWPPEWRWLAEGERSPWLPSMRLYRQARDGGWDAALAALRKDLQPA